MIGDEAFDGASPDEVGFDDLRDVRGLHMGVPDSVRVNQNGGPDVAKTDARAIRTHEIALDCAFSLQTTGAEFLHEARFDRGGSVFGAMFPVADEDMLFERYQIFCHG